MVLHLLFKWPKTVLRKTLFVIDDRQKIKVFHDNIAMPDTVTMEKYVNK